MNSTQYATAIMDELRGWTYEWLEGLLGIRRHQSNTHSIFKVPQRTAAAYGFDASGYWTHTVWAASECGDAGTDTLCVNPSLLTNEDTDIKEVVNSEEGWKSQYDRPHSELAG
ncbi:hypothetical protein B0H14DRAFT_2610602 [Mycena olivaceomarginata]|nr:hypothetical protein B0H14DRAFT_2610602 [Mycena olivaceomarginata]